MFGPVDIFAKAMEQTLHDAMDEALPDGVRYDPVTERLVGSGLTRFDPSTKTRVPVTQEWIDEAVAEIVRLNIELSAMPGTDPGVTLPEVDRIWEAVRAASAV